MKKQFGSILAVSAIILGLVTILSVHYLKAPGTNTPQTVNRWASAVKISGLSELKKKSDTIVEVIGSDKTLEIDYKGTTSFVTTVEVADIIKGDKNLKEIKLIQMSDDVTPKNGEKLLMFLRKGVDNPDCYVPVGSGQGIYKVVKSNSKKSTSDEQVIEPQSLVNEDILKDLKGNYKDVKSKLVE